MAWCQKCNCAMEHKHVERVEGASGVVRVAMRNFPVERCPTCGEQSFEVGAFMTTVVREFAVHNELRHAKSKGLFHKTWVCCQCGQELKDTPMPQQFDLKLPLPDGTPLEVEIHALSHNCFSCATKQLALEGGAGREIAQAFGSALETAMKAGDAGISRPSGS